MEYPFWDVGIGYGVLMGGIAVFHVFISHFAIGGGLYLVLAETAARKANDLIRLEFLERLSKFFVLTTVVMGAVTGVGIWFVIGLLSPSGTEALIHNFVWGWAIEWTFFATEILAALLYYYGWKKLSAKNHLIIGWIYFGAAWMSLFVINGIVAFMLTPGEWLITGDFWDGFFNPTFWSSLVFRTGICIMLAGLFALLVASRMKPTPDKARLVRYSAIWGVVGLVIMTPSFLWYFRAIPEQIRINAETMMPHVMARLDQTYWFAAVLAVVIIVFGLLIPKRYNLGVAVVAMALGLVWFGQFEWMREAIRKPYVISGYMYGNGVEVARAEEYQLTGLLASIEVPSDDSAADLYRHACQSCHTVDGYKPLAPHFDGTDEQFVANMVRSAGVMRGNMPPFTGTEDESYLIAAYIREHVDRRHIKDI